MTQAEEKALAALHNGEPHLTNIEALEEAIKRHEAYMESREISYPMYFTSPYGREHDIAHMRELLEQLESEKQSAKNAVFNEMYQLLHDIIAEQCGKDWHLMPRLYDMIEKARGVK